MSDPSLLLFAGNPNTGKSTLYNALTGSSAPVSNYTGTTVSLHRAEVQLGGRALAAVDLPGSYSLASHSPEERIAIDALLGRSKHGKPDALVLVCDAGRLARSLYLTLQVLELRVPTVVVLNMMDEARAVGRVPDTAELERVLGVPVVGVVARTGEGLDELKRRLDGVFADPASATPGARHGWSSELTRDADEVAAALGGVLGQVAGGHPDVARALGIWLLLSVDEDGTVLTDPDVPVDVLHAVHRRAHDEGRDLTTEIVGQRYAWIDAREASLHEGARDTGPTASETIDAWLMRPWVGAPAFALLMLLIFQALFAWSDPAIGFIEGAFGALGGLVAAGFDGLGAGGGGGLTIARDLVVDGIIGGVGSILVFLPQIALLFLFIAILEDCGYLARAAQLMDRVLRAAGLPGQAFVPLLSGFACAVPAAMATRTMPRWRDRLLTMMVIPLTSCSARLPVYTLVIATVFPPSIEGFPLSVRPLALFGMYLFSTVVTVLAAIVLGNTVLDERPTRALIELPPYRMPHWPTVLRNVRDRSWDFVREAGGVILVATIVLWALLYFPRYEPTDLLEPEVVAAAMQDDQDLAELAAPLAIQHSYAGQLGQALEPALEPLGYDWRIGIGLIGSFAAREVFVTTMGVVYGVGDADEDSADLRSRIASATWPDGRKVYTPLTGVSLMVFFALALQCTSTIAVLKKETGGWKWPAFIFGYMSLLAYVAALLVFQVGSLLGFQ